jgi:hypothetical protein
LTFDGCDELESVDLASRRIEQVGEVAKSLGVSEPKRVPVEHDRPVLTLSAEGGRVSSHSGHGRLSARSLGCAEGREEVGDLAGEEDHVERRADGFGLTEGHMRGLPVAGRVPP